MSPNYLQCFWPPPWFFLFWEDTMYKIDGLLYFDTAYPCVGELFYNVNEEKGETAREQNRRSLCWKNRADVWWRGEEERGVGRALEGLGGRGRGEGGRVGGPRQWLEELWTEKRGERTRWGQKRKGGGLIKGGWGAAKEGGWRVGCRWCKPDMESLARWGVGWTSSGPHSPGPGGSPASPRFQVESHLSQFWGHLGDRTIFHYQMTTKLSIAFCMAFGFVLTFKGCTVS